MEPDMETKLKAVIELCEEGDPEACAFLGKEFYFGFNIEQDLDRAFRYLTVAGKNGDALSQFLTGFMHWSGRGTEPDQDKALEWFLLTRGSRKRCTTSRRSCSRRTPKRTGKRP